MSPQSNGISHITDMEAKLGDMLRERFTTKNDLDRWAGEHGLTMLDFWEYCENKREGIHLAPMPLRNWRNGHDKTYLVFGDELAMKILVLGIP